MGGATRPCSSCRHVFLLVSLQLLLVAPWQGETAARALNFTRQDFPRAFVFGAGTSAYQYEGATDEDGRSPSIWDTFTHLGRMPDKSTGDLAADGYHKYKFKVEENSAEGDPVVIDMDSSLDEDKGLDEEHPEDMDHDGFIPRDDQNDQENKKKKEAAQSRGQSVDGNVLWTANNIQDKIDSGIINKKTGKGEGTISPARFSKRLASVADQDSLERAKAMKARRNLEATTIKGSFQGNLLAATMGETTAA